jgi:hypothetical protein
MNVFDLRLDGPGSPDADAAPAPDQPPGVEQGQPDLDLVELVVWGRGVLEAEGDGFGGHGETSLGERGSLGYIFGATTSSAYRSTKGEIFSLI